MIVIAPLRVTPSEECHDPRIYRDSRCRPVDFEVADRNTPPSLTPLLWRIWRAPRRRPDPDRVKRGKDIAILQMGQDAYREKISEIGIALRG
jgi:hypothetical protein